MPFFVRSRNNGKAFELRIKHGWLPKPVYHTFDVQEDAQRAGQRAISALDRGEIPSWLEHKERGCDDNAFIESLFRTAKYRPEFPDKGFATVEHARHWVREFASWYNHDHRHSGIRYVSPAQRHAGQDRAILAARHELYTQMKSANPRRWSRHTRNWTPIATVTLNPERDSVVQLAVHEEKKRSVA